MAPKQTPANKQKKTMKKASTTGQPAKRVTRSSKRREANIGESFIEPKRYPDPSLQFTVGNSPLIAGQSRPVTGSSDGVQEVML